MLATAQDIYMAFLDAIRKQHTGVVKPSYFTRLWNIYAMIEWIAQNSCFKEGVELTQKQLDDLRMLRRIEHIDPESGLENTFLLPGCSPVADMAVPKYKRALRIKFKLDYDTTADQEEGFTGESKYLKSFVMRSDEESIIEDSHYRKPSDSNLYYRFIKNYIVMITDPDIGSDAKSMYLDYLVYPNEMYFADTWTYDIDLPSEQLKEIIDVAARIYLKRIKDPLFQAELQGEVMRQPERI